MAVKASSNITLYHVIDVASVTIYYLLQSSTANPPAKPTTDNPGGNWTTTEPTYTEGSTNTLYTVTKTKYSDGTFEYTPVSKSTSYEAAKNAYNKALNAEQTVDNLVIGGRNYISNIDSNWISGNWKIPTAGQPTTIVTYNGRISLVKQIKVEPGKTYWIKLYTKNDEDNNINLDNVLVLFRHVDNDGNYLGNSTISLKNSKWICPASCEYIAVTLYENCIVDYITNGLIRVKLELGDKPTDWSYSPEDIDFLINGVNTTAKGASEKINDFLNGETSSLQKIQSDLQEDMDTKIDAFVQDRFTTLVGEVESVQNGQTAYTNIQAINSVIRRATDEQGNPYIELGVEPTASIPETYRLRISNNEIYMVYGSGDSAQLQKLTSWYTKDGKSALEVNSLLTQQEMAIKPFSYIKNDDGSLSFRKIE